MRTPFPNIFEVSVNNDRKKDQDEAGNNSSQKTNVGEPNRSGQGKQTQGESSRGKQFEGGREHVGTGPRPAHDHERVARPEEVPRHGRTHDSEADDADPHRSSPWCARGPSTATRRPASRPPGDAP